MAALARLQRSFGGGGLLGATSLAPFARPTVPGQFDDAKAAPIVTLYDESGRPKPVASSSKSYNGNPGDSKNGDGEKGRDRGGRNTHKTEDDRERDRDRDRLVFRFPGKSWSSRARSIKKIVGVLKTRRRR